MDTQEQQEVIHSPLDVKTTVVNACSGSGKTYTLEKLALQHPAIPILYVVFSAAMETEAKARFPDNVKCSTIHKIAYERFGGRYHRKLGDLRVTDAIRLLGLDEDYRLARDIVDAVIGYCVSDLRDFPALPVAPDRIIAGDADYLGNVAKLARKLWSMMCDPKNNAAPMIHDGYLKLFHLSRPTLPYGLILLDEGQDTSPVMLAILGAQDCPLVVAGDTHQSIFRWRGAIDAMLLPAERRLYLTNSFRFGPRVGKVATTILKHCKNETRSVVGAGFHTRIGRIEGPRTVICRTNAGVLRRAAQAIEQNEPVAFVGGAKGYQFGRVADAYRLKSEERDLIRDPFLRSFRSWGAFELYAETADDIDAKGLIRTVTEYGAKSLDLVGAIERLEQPFSARGGVLGLGTGHKVKGLTIDDVELNNDFVDMTDAQGQFDAAAVDPQEANLIYVAATRAVKNLSLNLQLHAFLQAVE